MLSRYGPVYPALYGTMVSPNVTNLINNVLQIVVPVSVSAQCVIDLPGAFALSPIYFYDQGARSSSVTRFDMVLVILCVWSSALGSRD